MKTVLLSLSAVCVLTVLPSVAECAPIQLQATSVSEGNTNCNSYTVSGADFSFTSNIYGYCSGTGIGGTPGGTLTSVVAIHAPQYPSDTLGQGQTLGYINVPENPGRVAFLTGDISTSGMGPTITIPASATGAIRLETTTTLQGTLNACLLPSGAVGGGPCDPSYANFATVNINLTGTDVFTGLCISSSCTFSENFIANAASVPEPSTGVYLVFAGLAALVTSRKKSRVKQSESSQPAH